jgi:hypothetical protein
MEPENTQTPLETVTSMPVEQPVQQTSEHSVPQPEEGSEQMSQVPQPEETGTKPADKFKKLLPKLVKILLIIFVIIGALFFINLFAPRAIQILQNNNPLAGTPTPEPSPTATPVANNPPSRYASDPDVQEIDAQLKKLEDGLNAIEFTDDTLHPPLLNWDISFSGK